MDIVSAASKRFGNSPALFTPEKRLSFQECDLQSARIAATLAALGIGPGDVVAVVAPNSPELLLLLMALLRIGAVAAPVNHRFPSNHIHGVLDRLNPALTLFDPEACPELGTEKAVSFEMFANLNRANTTSAFIPATDIGRPASIIHTSASSGKPKAAMHSLSNHWHSAMGSAENLPFGPGDCWLLSLPLYHTGGYAMLFKCLLGGGALATAGASTPLEAVLPSFPVTHLSLVPTQLYRLLRSANGEELLKRLKVILLGGSAASQALLQEAIDAGLSICLTYGSTEMGSQVSTSCGPIASPTRDSGNVLPFREVSISPEGEILVKGPCLFMGYLQGSRLNTARDAKGWFHTGDVGTMSENGTLTVLGRRDNMFISGGENIHPEEIEDALTAIEGIEEALVVPVADKEYGMRPMAWIRVSGRCTTDDDALTSMAAAALGGLKTPVAFRRISAWTTIPGSAKIDRGWYLKSVTRDP